MGKRCEGCYYWRPLSACNTHWMACHYALDTEKLRYEKDGVCYSRLAKKQKIINNKTEGKK